MPGMSSAIPGMPGMTAGLPGATGAGTAAAAYRPGIDTDPKGKRSTFHHICQMQEYKNKSALVGGVK